MSGNGSSDRIIVGVDGSELSIAALRYGARLAEAFDAPLHAVMVWGQQFFPETAVHQPWTPETDAKTMLAATIHRAFGEAAPPRLTSAELPGPVTRTLIEESAHASMLVVGNRGHGGFAGLQLGSVSAACAAHAHCPVLIVRSSSGT